jgi:hypothetical protein
MNRCIKRKIVLFLLMVMGTVLLSGCLRITADELYSLPEISEEYLRLQAHINLLLNQGAEFAPPTGGPNRQAVQLKDLNGSGTSEVIAFFSIPGESAIQVYIFEMVDGDYAVADIIESVGTEIESVRYIDMDGDGIMELVIGWQMGSVLRYMSIYSVAGFQHQMLVSGVEYSALTVYDMTGDGTDDVIVFRLPTTETGSVAEMYSLMQDGEIVMEEARLSNGVESISRILTGSLIDGTPAVFVDGEGSFENGSLATDILAIQRDNFTNISITVASGVSEETVRHMRASADINRDGVIKVPAPRLLIAQSETEYFAIDWYAFRISGQSNLMLTTYHNNFDEWYLILPFDWREKVSVRREDAVPGERTIIFSYFADAEAESPHEDFLKILKLSGENAEERASFGNRVLLMTEGASAYAFELLAPPDSFGLTFNEASIKENFRLIYSDWLTGVVY